MLAYDTTSHPVDRTASSRRPLGRDYPNRDRLVDQLADDFITLNAQGGCTKARLAELGWSADFIETNLSEAQARANARFVRSVDDDPAPSLGSIETQMAAIIAGLLPPTQIIVAELQARGFSARHIDLLLNKARARAALAFCHGHKGAH